MAKPEKELDLYFVDKKYIRDLSKIDDRVLSVSPQSGKDTRPFVGIVIIMDEKEYCIPLTSPKTKFAIKSHDDFIKIPDPKLKDPNGAPKTIGILNINNMIPVSHQILTKIDLSNNSEYDAKRCNLLRKEIEWCRNNKELIQRKANKVYQKVTLTPERDRNLTRRCCNFKKLEEILNKRLEKDFQEEKTATVPNKANEQKNANIPYEQRLERAQGVIHKTNAILNANPKLKKDFIAAKKEFEKNQSLNSVQEKRSTSEEPPKLNIKPQKPKH